MKRLMVGIACSLCLINLVGCQRSQDSSVQSVEPISTETAKPNSNQNASVTTKSASDSKQTTAEKTPTSSKPQPKSGTIKSIVDGDLLCYVTLLDEDNVEQQVGASFEICANKQPFLNRKVNLFYEIASVNDCQSIEPCGKSRQQSIISRMELVSGTPNSSNNTQTISNGQWTITVGNFDSWSGVNNTGNLTYRGCDAKGNCLNLKDGRVSCRDGICTAGWQNGDYSYVLQTPMDDPDRPREPGSATTLIVRQGAKEIVRATGFKVVSP